MRAMLLAAVAACAFAMPAWAGPPARPDLPEKPHMLAPIGNVGVGIIALVSTLIYAPVKIAVSVFVLPVVWPFEKALPTPVVQCLTAGDYVVTTDMLMGRDELHFTRCPHP